MLCPTVHRTSLSGMDILAQVLDRVRLGGTLLFHFELGHPWNLALPERPYALFHYLSRGSATLALEQGKELRMDAGDFVVVTRGEPHLIYSDRRTEPLPILNIDRLSQRLGVVRHGGRAKPLSTMICGNFTVSRPPVRQRAAIAAAGAGAEADGGRRLARSHSAAHGERVGARASRPARRAVATDGGAVCRGAAKLDQDFSPGQGGWLGAISDPHIGPALKLIHENPEHPWTLRDLGQRVGLGRSVFSARFSKLVGQSMQRYVISRRMAEAAYLLESTEDGIARIASRVGYETAAAFSKLFHRHHGLSPGRYRAAQRLDEGKGQVVVSGKRSRRATATKRKSGKR